MTKIKYTLCQRKTKIYFSKIHYTRRRQAKEPDKEQEEIQYKIKCKETLLKVRLSAVQCH